MSLCSKQLNHHITQAIQLITIAKLETLIQNPSYERRSNFFISKRIITTHKSQSLADNLTNIKNNILWTWIFIINYSIRKPPKFHQFVPYCLFIPSSKWEYTKIIQHHYINFLSLEGVYYPIEKLLPKPFHQGHNFIQLFHNHVGISHLLYHICSTFSDAHYQTSTHNSYTTTLVVINWLRYEI